MTTTNPTPAQQETLEPEPILLDRGDVLDAVALFCSNFETLGERFKKQLRNTIRAIPPRRAAVAGPQGVIELLSASLLHPESAEGYVRQAIEMLSVAATSSPAPAESDDDDEDRVWERQSTINSIAYEFMKLLGVTAKDGKTHDEMRPLFDAAREIITRTYPVLIDLHVPTPAERTRVAGEQGWKCACGWHGTPSQMTVSNTLRTCPRCGGSGGLILDVAAAPADNDAESKGESDA